MFAVSVHTGANQLTDYSSRPAVVVGQLVWPIVYNLLWRLLWPCSDGKYLTNALLDPVYPPLHHLQVLITLNMKVIEKRMDRLYLEINGDRLGGGESGEELKWTKFFFFFPTLFFFCLQGEVE